MFSSPLQTENKPWTSPVRAKEGNYKFVVLPDRTGGPETHVFDRAIQEINRLAPDFVITSGDLIDGYVSDVSWSAPQWADVLARLSKLDAPFFFVGGNHDLSNKAQSEDFARRFGATYYSFSVGKDLFLVLDTESESPMSDAQIGYFESVLKDWSGRHVYVFMHSPLWYPKNRGGYEKIDAMLSGHEYTVFSGHTHWYYMEERNGMEYYIVATAGGDSQLRGVNLGEFDHYLLVSARDGKPAIANIPLGAMLPNDVVSKETKPLVDWMLGSKYVSIPRVELPSESPRTFEINMEFVNVTTSPMKAAAKFPEREGMSFTPSVFEGTLSPGEAKHLTVKVDNSLETPVGKIAVETTCGFTLNGKPESVSSNMNVFTDFVHKLDKSSPVAIECKDPYYVKEDWDWHGADDGWFDFTVSLEGKYVMIDVKTHDDIIVHDADHDKPQDKVEILFSTGDIENKYELFEDGCIKVPVKQIQDKTFKLNVVFTDCDNPRNTKPSALWWRRRGENSTFVIK